MFDPLNFQPPEAGGEPVAVSFVMSHKGRRHSENQLFAEEKVKRNVASHRLCPHSWRCSGLKHTFCEFKSVKWNNQIQRRCRDVSTERLSGRVRSAVLSRTKRSPSFMTTLIPKNAARVKHIIWKNRENRVTSGSRNLSLTVDPKVWGVRAHSGMEVCFYCQRGSNEWRRTLLLGGASHRVVSLLAAR